LHTSINPNLLAWIKYNIELEKVATEFLHFCSKNNREFDLAELMINQISDPDQSRALLQQRRRDRIYTYSNILDRIGDTLLEGEEILRSDYFLGKRARTKSEEIVFKTDTIEYVFDPLGFY